MTEKPFARLSRKSLENRKMVGMIKPVPTLLPDYPIGIKQLAWPDPAAAGPARNWFEN